MFSHIQSFDIVLKTFGFLVSLIWSGSMFNNFCNTQTFQLRLLKNFEIIVYNISQRIFLFINYNCNVFRLWKMIKLWRIIPFNCNHVYTLYHMLVEFIFWWLIFEKKVISTLSGYLNSGLSYLNTAGWSSFHLQLKLKTQLGEILSKFKSCITIGASQYFRKKTFQFFWEIWIQVLFILLQL